MLIVRSLSSVRSTAGAAALTILAAGAGCADPSPRCKHPLTLDFRHQPTRAELAFGAGRNSASLTCRAVPTMVRLPSGSIAFSTGGYASSSASPSSAPDTVYVNSPPLSLDEAASLARRLAASVRMTPIAVIETWRARMAVVADADVQGMYSSYLGGRSGGVGISMQLRGSVDAGDEGTRTAEVQLTFLWRGSRTSPTTSG